VYLKTPSVYRSGIPVVRVDRRNTRVDSSDGTNLTQETPETQGVPWVPDTWPSARGRGRVDRGRNRRLIASAKRKCMFGRRRVYSFNGGGRWQAHSHKAGYMGPGS